MPVMTKPPPTENLLCPVNFSPIGITFQWQAVPDQSGCFGRAHPRMGGVAQQESGNANDQCPCPTGANELVNADADTAHIFFLLELCRPARKCGSLNHRSHFGSRYKLGCCGHAGLFGLGLKPTGISQNPARPHAGNICDSMDSGAA
jgi:hypothetical protein